MKFRETSLKETISGIKSSPQYTTDEGYILWMAKTTPWRGRRVAQIMKSYFETDAKILDVGTSQGLTIGYTAQVFANIQGADIDELAIKTARARLRKLGLKTKITLYDGKKLPFAKNSFDGVVSTEVFEHVDDPQNFVKELRRVLKQKGRLIISAPNKLYPIECEFHLPFLSYLPKNFADLYVRLSGKGKSYDHINHPTYKRFKNTVGKYFEIQDITFDIVKNYKKYYLDKERGKAATIMSGIMKNLDRLEKTPLSFIWTFSRTILTNLSAGWFFVCKKKELASL